MLEREVLFVLHEGSYLQSAACDGDAGDDDGRRPGLHRAIWRRDRDPRARADRCRENSQACVTTWQQAATDTLFDLLKPSSSEGENRRTSDQARG